jgi:nucleoside-diphosphate-sugar epimerase
VGATDPHTKNLLAALDTGTPPSALVYVSTTGVYGDCHGEVIDELRPTNPQSTRAKRRVDAEQQLMAWADKTKTSLTILRAPGIYAADRLPIERLRSGTPAIAAEEDSYTNHIHADDLARCIVAALHHGPRNSDARVYNCVDDSDLKMGDYFDLIADFANLPRPPRLSRAAIEAQVSPAMWSFMSESRRISNARMKRELEFALRYPAVSAFLRELEAVPSARGETRHQ